MAHKKPSRTISFRAEESLREYIAEKAAEMGISAGVWVRGLVIAELHRPTEDLAGEIVELKAALAAIDPMLEKLRINQAKVLFHILTKIGDMSAEEANALCRSKLMD